MWFQVALPAHQARLTQATFYLHYQDIFDLSEKLQNQIIAAIVAKLDDPMEIMTNPARFMRTFVAAVESEVEKIGIIFSGNQAGILPVSIVAQLKQSIYTQSPQLKDDPKVDVFLTYHILGSYYACMEKRDRLNYKQVLKILEEIQPSPLAFD